MLGAHWLAVFAFRSWRIYKVLLSLAEAGMVNCTRAVADTVVGTGCQILMRGRRCHSEQVESEESWFCTVTLWSSELVVEIHAYSDGANLVNNATVLRLEREGGWIQKIFHL
jgi:hypothetical protein